MQKYALVIGACLLAVLPVSGQAAQGTLAEIADRGELVIGYRANRPPFSANDENGQASGYTVDLCRRIATAVKDELKLEKLETRFVAVDLESRFDAVASGEIDILCGATTITLSRLEKVDFSLMTFLTGGSLLSKATNPIRTTSDLSAKKVVVIKGTSASSALKEYLEANLIDAQVETADSVTVARQMLDEGKVAAMANDQIVLIGQIMGAADPQSYALSEDLYSYEPYGLAVRRNDADFRLVVDRALASLYRSGQFKTLYNKWFGRVGVKPSPILAAMYRMQALPE